MSYGVFFSRLIHPGNVSAISTGTPTVIQVPLATYVPTSTQQIIATNSPPTQPVPFDISRPKLEGFIRVPSGVVAQPYVILSGYQSFPGDSGALTISGNVQFKGFYCPSSPCSLDFPETSKITFRVKNQAGDTSSEVEANILVTKVSGGYNITIITLGKFIVFSDSCANKWQNAESLPPDWAKFPQDPGELNTDKNLQIM